jgi:hypothetical protein
VRSPRSQQLIDFLRLVIHARFGASAREATFTASSNTVTLHPDTDRSSHTYTSTKERGKSAEHPQTHHISHITHHTRLATRPSLSLSVVLLPASARTAATIPNNDQEGKHHDETLTSVPSVPSVSSDPSDPSDMSYGHCVSPASAHRTPRRLCHLATNEYEYSRTHVVPITQLPL